MWLIIAYPYYLVIEDMLKNKDIQDNNVWIKRTKQYFKVIMTHYLIVFFCLSFWTGGAGAAMFAYCFYLVLYKYVLAEGYVVSYYFLKDAPTENNLTKEELEKVRFILASDNKHKALKIKIRIMGLITLPFFVLIGFLIGYNIFNQDAYLDKYTARTIAMGLIYIYLISYDIFEQKYFRRDITENFWEKRYMIYIFNAFPFSLFSILVFIM